jgi:putative CocE/NonD family hydrolase
VGMIGKSWGGFNCLQIAARQPPALRAIVPVCATDDRYGDDVHFMGGCLLVDGIEWGAAFQTFLPRPPDPEILGVDWRTVWDERLSNLTCPLEEWLTHLHRDEYWRHGSICENYEAITAATLLVGGWADGYKSALMRMAALLPGPTKCIIGPWAHLYPHAGVPGPAIGFLQEVVRWFDYWLNDVDNGVNTEPKLRAWIQEAEPPRTHYAERRGRWVAEYDWPSPSIASRVFHVTDAGLSQENGPLRDTTVPFNLAVGQFGGDWGGFALPFELPSDQRYDDSLSLIFESEPLDAPLEILGAGSVDLQISSDQAVAMLAARLNDVHPDGTTSRVAVGLLNLTQRDGDHDPSPLEEGTWYSVKIQLGAVGYRFQEGHRLRLALSPSYWPLAWPPPQPVRLRIRGQGSLTVPERNARTGHSVLFGPPEAASSLEIVTLSDGQDFKRQVTFDLAKNTVTRRVLGGNGAYGGDGLTLIPDIGLAFEYQVERRQTIDLDDPTSAATEFMEQITFQRDGWEAAVKTRVLLICTADEFVLSCDVEVTEDGKRVLERQWNPTFPRLHT